MDIKESVLDAIGNTPLLHLSRLESFFSLKCHLYAKLERCNPTGSIKDRAAKQLLLGAMERGEITKDTVIVEPTSGNTGIALASLAAAMGLHAVIVMPENCSKERILMMKAFGAEVLLTPAALGMEGAVKEAHRYAENCRSAFIPDQFGNSDNALGHYKTTGPEIVSQLDGKIVAFVCSFGTGGTLTGVGKYLKEKIPGVRLVGVEPFSSPFVTQGRKGAHKIQGIGAGFLPKVFDKDIVDEIMTVKDEEAYEMTRLLGRKEGLLCGISSGCNVFAAISVAKKKENEGKNVVTVLPDNGERYLSVEGLYE